MKNKINLTRGGILKADSDLSTAKKLIEVDGPFDTASFHVQQAIEKMLKAFLVFHEQPIPKIHDLDELQRRCLQICHLPTLEKIDLTEITDYAVEMRYDLEFWPEAMDVSEALGIAEKVHEIVLAALPEKCHP